MTILILLILLASALQYDWEDRGAAFVFVAPVIIYELFWKFIPDWGYYIGAGVLSFTALWVLRSYFWNRLSDRLSKAMFVSILLNFVGFILLHYKFDPDPYNNLFMAYYAWVLYILIDEGGLYVGISEICRNIVSFRGHAFKGISNLREETLWKKQA